MDIQELPASELTVMKVIWDAGEPVQLADIYAAATERYKKAWHYQTVSTYIRSLVKRGFLHMEQEGRAYNYTPAISEEEYLNHVMGKMARFWGKKPLKAFTCALREEEELTEEEFRKLEELIHEPIRQ